MRKILNITETHKYDQKVLTQIDRFFLDLNMLLTRRVFVGMGKIWVVSNPSVANCWSVSVGHLLPIFSSKAEPSSFDHGHVTADKSLGYMII